MWDRSGISPLDIHFISSIGSDYKRNVCLKEWTQTYAVAIIIVPAIASTIARTFLNWFGASLRRHSSEPMMPTPTPVSPEIKPGKPPTGSATQTFGSLILSSYSTTTSIRHIARINARPMITLYALEFSMYAPPINAIGIEAITKDVNRHQLK